MTGTIAMSGAMNNSVTVWDLESGQAVHDLPGHQGGITRVVVNEDGSCALSADRYGYLRAWRMDTGTRRGTWSADAPITACMLTGMTLIGGTEGGEVVIAEVVGRGGGLSNAAPKGGR